MIAFRNATLALLLAASPLAAQQATKKPLTVADFDQWRTIRGDTLSADGRWAAYTLMPQVGNGELVVRGVPNGPEYRHTRGFIGRPQTRPGAERGDAFTAPNARFSADSRFVVFTIEPPQAEVERARRAKKKPADQPKTALGIMRLSDGKVTEIPQVKSFKLAKDSGRYVAYLAEKDSAAAADTTTASVEAAAATPGGTPRPITTDTATRKGRKKKEYGSTLVLRELETGAETRIADVVAYTFDERGDWLGYTVSSPRKANDGAYVRSLRTGATSTLLAGEGNYKGLTFDKQGTQVAFVSDRDEYAKEDPRFSLYYTQLRNPAAREVLSSARAGAGLVVAEGGNLDFSEDGRAITFGVTPAPLDSIPADSLADKAVFDLWHYRDARLQPQQRAEMRRDRDRSFAAVYHLGSGRYVRIGNDTLQQVRFSENARRALATTQLPYAVEAMWGEGGTDVYLIDAVSGARRKVASRVPFGATLSPGGGYVLYFGEDRQWHAYDAASGRTRNLTGGLTGVQFARETWDTPDDPAPWGVAGWTQGDRSVLLYDRYDVWEIDPAGKRPARVVTDSVGRRGKLVFRLTDLKPEERSINPANPLFFRVTDDETKASGFWRDRLGVVAPPEQLIMENRQLAGLSKATDVDVFAFTQSAVQEFPNLWVSGPQFTDPVKISDANPQQDRYRWASAELVRWRSNDGVELKGLLYKPENFDPNRKYPMVVYFYEQLSDNLHQYRMDVPRNTIQPTLYTSNDYLVFMPDIHYTDGYPGPSALKSIVPGVQMLINRGFVDPEAVGLQGQSWGGYQAAYMITQTPMFAAAMAGAPVANMTSAYGGIRWQSGLARAFQYEKGQSRIGGSLWEQPTRYIENSPLFFADRVTTPLLIMHNDNDGAVPWYQGIEMFVALRRLGKEVYMINYNGDEHNPTKRANQLDIALRMQQFFDHHLKGAPAPAWMQQGIPFLQKGRDQLAPATAVPVTTEVGAQPQN